MRVTAKLRGVPNITPWLDRMGFIRISDFSMEDFLPYQKNIRHPDLSYSLLYAWELDYLYRIRIMDGNPVIVGFDVTGDLFFSVIPAVADTFMGTARTVIGLLSGLGVDFSMKYVTKECVNLFQQSGLDLTFDPDFSDYIYESGDFVQLTGNRNKTKRHEYHGILKRYPDCRYEDMGEENYGDITRIFDRWCDSHSCENCVWGCERRAFSRLFELVRGRPDHYYGGIVYLDGAPASFGIAERINDDWVSYHAQKNAVAADGLTYYLHYMMALRHQDVPYINWGEDMGIEGLRRNKQRYHPCHMEHKYEISFRCGKHL